MAVEPGIDDAKRRGRSADSSNATECLVLPCLPPNAGGLRSTGRGMGIGGGGGDLGLNVGVLREEVASELAAASLAAFILIAFVWMVPP